MRRWAVGGALIPHGDGLVLVGNRRRDGSLDWTPPGGVIDHGETVLDGLTREVREETGLHVVGWARRAYTLTLEAPDMGWVLVVEAWEASGTEGEVCIDDPDGIVEEVRAASAADAASLMATSPPWVREPVAAWLDGVAVDEYAFVLSGTSRSSSRVERIR